MTQKMLGTRDVALALGVSPALVRLMVMRGQLPRRKLGQRVLYFTAADLAKAKLLPRYPQYKRERLKWRAENRRAKRKDAAPNGDEDSRNSEDSA